MLAKSSFIRPLYRSLCLAGLLIGLLAGVLVQGGAPAQASPTYDAASFPVVPYAGARARQLVLLGRRRGNRPNVFSKVGDSITAWGYFLAPIGTGGLRLGSYPNLGRAAQYFSQAMARTNNSFANESLAAAGGWTSWDVLTPGKVGGGCAGTTPLECELAITKPSIALIMIGTNDLSYGDINAFTANLDRIVSICESYGVVPVVSTIPIRKDRPDAESRVGVYNDAIIRVALAHGAPLWNYWLAMEQLPNHGLTGDNVHPSVPPDNNTAIFDVDHLQYGFTIRNLTALQVLNNLLAVLR